MSALCHIFRYIENLSKSRQQQVSRYDRSLAVGSTVGLPSVDRRRLPADMIDKASDEGLYSEDEVMTCRRRSAKDAKRKWCGLCGDCATTCSSRCLASDGTQKLCRSESRYSHSHVQELNSIQLHTHTHLLYLLCVCYLSTDVFIAFFAYHIDNLYCYYDREYTITSKVGSHTGAVQDGSITLVCGVVIEEA